MIEPALVPARRHTRLVILTVAVLVVAAGTVLAHRVFGRAPQDTSELPGRDAPSTITMVGADEPGAPLRVSGQVFLPDGETPAPGIVLYVYQTDLTGRYNRLPRWWPRLRGWMKTDAEGRYEYRTVRPASYPDSSIPQHVHTQLWGEGVPPQWGKDLNFADDPFVSAYDKSRAAAAGRFDWVCEPRRDAAGVTECVHNLRLKTTGDDFGATTRHGFDADPQ